MRKEQAYSEQKPEEALTDEQKKMIDNFYEKNKVEPISTVLPSSTPSRYRFGDKDESKTMW